MKNESSKKNRMKTNSNHMEINLAEAQDHYDAGRKNYNLGGESYLEYYREKYSLHHEVLSNHYNS